MINFRIKIQINVKMELGPLISLAYRRHL